MFDLFKAELFRFRYWALAYLLAHGAVMAFFGRVTDLLQQDPMVVQGVTAAYGVSGVLLGLYQMSSYRRPNRWLNLIHRPLDPRRIAGALVGAAGALIAVALVLPWLVMLSVQDLASSRVVDSRHWLLPPAIFLIGFAAYLAGAYAVLGVRRYAALVLILPALLAFSNATGLGAIAVQALVAAWLLYLVLSAFKPNPTELPRRAPELIATAVPVQLAIYLVILAVGGIVFQLGWIMAGTHPLNSTPPKGGFIEAARGEGPDVLAAGLEGKGDPQSRLWREQARISDAFKLQLGFDALPVRGELTNSVPIRFADEERGVEWTFSHDSMRFEGRKAVGGAPYHSLGLGEAGEAFERPPVSVGEGTFVDARSVASFDPDLELILLRITVPAGETVAAAPVAVGESIALLTDKAVYFYDGHVLEADDREFPMRQRVPLQGKIGNLERIDLIELLDGYLVSQVFGRGDQDGAGIPVQHLVKTDGEGRVAAVARRPLRTDFPELARFKYLWLSPAMSAVHDRAIDLFAADSPLQAHEPADPPSSVWTLALALALISLAGAWWWGGRVGLGRPRRFGWALASALVGLPAFLSLILFHPRAPEGA
jgi:hypothetical protein